MNQLIYIVGGLFALFLVLSLWLAVSRMKLAAAKRDGDSRLIQLEARMAELELVKQQLEKRTPPAKPSAGKAAKGSDGENTELLSARKETAKYRDEAQKLRVELRQKEAELKEAREGVEKRLYVLQEENRRLLEIAKEQDRKLSVGDSEKSEQLATLRSEVERLRDDLQTERRRASDQERSAGRSSEQLKSLQERLVTLQSENQKWRDAASENNGKPIDAFQFFRWQRRALAGRDMYQMMKQLRELSDHKLEVYQNGIERIATYLLIRAGKTLPVPSQGEVFADRLLGEALGTLSDLGHTMPDAEGDAADAPTHRAAPAPDAETAHSES
jgi:hypothetical protein